MNRLLPSPDINELSYVNSCCLFLFSKTLRWVTFTNLNLSPSSHRTTIRLLPQAHPFSLRTLAYWVLQSFACDLQGSARLHQSKSCGARMWVLKNRRASSGLVRYPSQSHKLSYLPIHVMKFFYACLSPKMTMQLQQYALCTTRVYILSAS